MKFKVGDKVKCIKACSFWPMFQVNKVYEVKEFENQGDDPEWNSVVEGKQWVIVNHYLICDSFELIKENTMSKVNYHLLTDSVVINYNAKTFVVRQGDQRFGPIVAAIKENRLNDIPDLIDVEANFVRQGMKIKDGLLHIEGDALPDGLSQRVLHLLEEKMPIDIMVKFWKNLKSNPSFNSRKMLYQFLEHNGHPLTEDGCFIAYRGVTNDFKDKHTRTFDNSVGSVCSVNRDQVDDNPNNTCSHGLHVACHDYAKGFGEKLIEVKVNPADVVAVPVDYNGTKMRVSKFEVMAVCENVLTGSVYKGEEVKAKHALRGPDGRFVSKVVSEDEDSYPF